jgi:hypothetical protein
VARGKTADKITITNRQIMALDLRKSGFSYRAIADRTHTTHVQAYRDVQNELKRLSEISLESAGELRLMELERLDIAIKGLMPFVEAGSAIHATALTKVIAERSKLLGLYAPEKYEEQVTVKHELSDDERASRIAAILERGRQERARQSDNNSRLQ